MTFEILDIILGFAIGTNRQRGIEFQRALGRTQIAQEERWVFDQRTALIAELPRFRQMAMSRGEEIASLYRRIAAELEPEGHAS